MRDEKFTATVDRIVDQDPRYAAEAYAFISDAVLYTTKKLEAESHPQKRHITGKELLEGIKEFAMQQFGPIAPEVLRHWGLNDTMAIGHVVFNMVNNHLLGKSQEDTIDDFRNGFDFDMEFSKPFLPEDTPMAPIPVID